jgi:phosphohistidine phosphatase
MMILYLIRHAWAEEPDDPKWTDDRARPLTEAGKERFAKMVKVLVDRGFAPQLIATSPLVRCRQTSEIVAKHAPERPKVIERAELEPGSDLEGILHWTRSQAGDLEEVAWVCHAPDAGNMAASLIGDPSGAIRFAKGAMAAIRFPGLPGLRKGELNWLVTAKILGF